MQKRKDELDYARSFCMFLVVVGHIYTQKNTFIMHYIGSIDMPLFFFISGYLFKVSDSITNDIKKKVNQLLVPYFIWCFLSFLYWVIIERHFRVDSVSLSVFDGFKGIFLAKYQLIIYNAVLWFLPVLFLMNIIVLFIISKINNTKLANILLFCLVTIFSISSCLFDIPDLPWCFNKLMRFMVFFYVGYIFRLYESIFLNYKEYVIVITVSIHFFMLYFGLERKWFDIILGICGSIATVLICKVISNYVAKYNKDNNILIRGMLYFGRNTILVFILHGPFYRACLGLIGKIFRFDITYFRASIICVISLSIFVIFSLLIISRVINRYAPILVGKNNLQSKKNNSRNNT